MPYIPTMPNNRTIPAITIAILLAGSFQTHGQPNPPAQPGPAGAPNGAAATPAKAAPPTEAELLLDQAIKKAKTLDSVTADILEKVEMLDQKFSIKGRYLKAPNDRLFLRMEVEGLADASGLMQQVCDGTTLWEYQKVFETQIYRKLDAGTILTKLRQVDLDQESRDTILVQLGFAGPEALLVGLRKAITFDQKTKGTLDDKPVWIIRGNWTNREGLFGPNAQPLGPTVRLPSYVPSLVSVYLGEEDLWPYKVMLVSQPTSAILEDSRPIGPNGKRIGPISSIQKPLLTRIQLIYSGVKLNTPVSDQEFVFTPPKDLTPKDETATILNFLEQAATARAAQKKAEAAKGQGQGEDALLNQSIDVPKAAAPAPTTEKSAPAPK